MQPDEERAARRPPGSGDSPALDAPVDDVAEQLAVADPGEEVDSGPDSGSVAGRGLEVGEWDAAEQTRPAGQEDDYR